TPGTYKKNKKKNNEKTTTPSVGSLTSASTPVATDGRTDGNLSESTTPAAPESVASGLVEATSIQADLERIDLRPTQRRALVDAVDAALLRFSEAQVSQYLRTKAREARTSTWLISAFTVWVDTIAEIPKSHQSSDSVVLAAVEAAVSTGKAFGETTFAPSPEVIAAPTVLATPRGPRSDCNTCQGDGWVLGADGDPVEPARRCACPSDPPF
ncbi:hypothetical protein, partial [Nocardia fluminea]|uniref:hypothetical protein n=1 Tax=Nocardia fluminea TaxID=134984 RepID=UPI0036521BBB